MTWCIYFNLEYSVILKNDFLPMSLEFLDLPIANGFTIFTIRRVAACAYHGAIDEDDCVSRWKVRHGKMSSYQYRDPHVKDKTVSRPSYL